jgi:3-deoxy-manno-octulosonate cytidylyltransferase (CMP-KDO synthetase)
MNKFHVIIPARYHSTRLPAKPLVKIGDKPMIVHVCDRAKQSGAASVTVATDHQTILDEVNRYGYAAVMTQDNHRTGSDRLYEASSLIGLDDDEIIVNVQGDEPFIPTENIDLVASLVNKSNAKMASLCCVIESYEELVDPNIVKVVFNQSKQAIYFSRSAIPYVREGNIKLRPDLVNNHYRHIGIYAYTKKFLSNYIQWPSTPLELSESLEQLRVIENGHVIQMACLNKLPPHGVDTQVDLEKARSYYQSNLEQLT